MDWLLEHAEREIEGWQEDFEAFLARFDYVFWRTEPRQTAGGYLRGLLSHAERKNACQLAEVIGKETPDATQRLLYKAQWAADEARNVLRDFIVERFGDAEGIGVLDETGFLKNGSKAVGVARQYSGTAGKVDNCQVATLLCYATPEAKVFVDRRLYLPKEWCGDAERRKEAGVPEEVTFQTKPEQGVAMLASAWKYGVPMHWVTGDEVYGNAPALRQFVSEHQRLYVLAVSCSTPVWRQRPPVEEPGQQTGGRPRTKPRLAAGAPPPERVDVVTASWGDHRWQRLRVAEGEKGPRVYDWACQRVVEDRGGLPGEEVWLLVRRSVSDPSEVAYYLSNAPLAVPLKKMAEVASTRFAVEECIKEAKGEVGLDHYEVRQWDSWHRHITLSLMAHTWLTAIRQKAPRNTAGPVPFWRT